MTLIHCSAGVSVFALKNSLVILSNYFLFGPNIRFKLPIFLYLTSLISVVKFRDLQ